MYFPRLFLCCLLLSCAALLVYERLYQVIHVNTASFAFSRVSRNSLTLLTPDVADHVIAESLLFTMSVAKTFLLCIISAVGFVFCFLSVVHFAVFLYQSGKEGFHDRCRESQVPGTVYWHLCSDFILLCRLLKYSDSRVLVQYLASL